MALGPMDDGWNDVAQTSTRSYYVLKFGDYSVTRARKTGSHVSKTTLR
jgi:hypothetical protein